MRNICSRPIVRAIKSRQINERAELEASLLSLREMRRHRCAQRQIRSLSVLEAA